jgi:hippurate hydrolase
MTLVADIVDALPELTNWRRTLHAIPETAFEEHRTSAFVAERLESFGIPFERGIAGTGIVATLKGKGEGPSIGLRADMDALDIEETTNLSYRSTFPGKMHACGHDGHMTMLLGAAQHLARTRDFAGTVHFIFQPAEEMAGGGKVMVEEGLFDRFPMERVFGLHTWPGTEVGAFLGRVGPMLAASDVFELTIGGKAAHGAMPHLGIDPVVVAAEIVSALQTIASRSANPNDAVVVSVTQIHGGDAWNIIPERVVLRGTVRTFLPETRDLAERRVGEITRGICAAHGAEARVWYERRYPATVNPRAEISMAFEAVRRTVGDAGVIDDAPPSMASEDFAYMLEHRPGAYLWVGSGDGAPLHNPNFDFNDEVLPVGASYWVRLVEGLLPTS